MSTFFDDIKAVRPTGLPMIPAIANAIYAQLQEHLKGAEGAAKQVGLINLVIYSSCIVWRLI